MHLYAAHSTAPSRHRCSVLKSSRISSVASRTSLSPSTAPLPLCTRTKTPKQKGSALSCRRKNQSKARSIVCYRRSINGCSARSLAFRESATTRSPRYGALRRRAMSCRRNSTALMRRRLRRRTCRQRLSVPTQRQQHRKRRPRKRLRPRLAPWCHSKDWASAPNAGAQQGSPSQTPSFASWSRTCDGSLRMRTRRTTMPRRPQHALRLQQPRLLLGKKIARS
mmetsp:Transcript_31141/g.85317  ORF Transcript_31141/g.85317 Transcript_31141/m.85317 type:complete len:223 (-) Transcript_31141:1006-1674(-)